MDGFVRLFWVFVLVVEILPESLPFLPESLPEILPGWGPAVKTAAGARLSIGASRREVRPEAGSHLRGLGCSELGADW